MGVFGSFDVETSDCVQERHVVIKLMKYAIFSFSVFLVLVHEFRLKTMIVLFMIRLKNKFFLRKIAKCLYMLPV